MIDGADRVSVLRDGDLVEAGVPVATLTEAELARLMLGRVLGQISSGGGHARRGTELAVELRDIDSARLTGVSLNVAPGEIVGVTGLADSGYHEVPYFVSGAAPTSAGRLIINNAEVDLAHLTPTAASDVGIVLVPGDRDGAGLAMELTVLENAALPRTSARGRRFVPISRRDERAALEPWLDRLELRPRDPNTVVAKLSGGNQQKVVLAKWLARKPTLLALDQPTQAVDVGAREIIVNAVKDAAAAGCAVLVASGDENELSMLCDRILIFSDGRIQQELTGPSGPDDIVDAIFGGTERRPLRTRLPARTTNIDQSLKEDEQS